MDKEYQSLMVNKTWSLVPLPTGRSAIGCRWTFKFKRGPDESIQRHKARFVAKGYSQRPGVDYLEIYSPVVKLESLRLYSQKVSASIPILTRMLRDWWGFSELFSWLKKR